MSECIFCGDEPATRHHLIPKGVRKLMGWVGTKKARLVNGNYHIPLCSECHLKLNHILEPLVFIIKCLKPEPPKIPVKLAFIMEDSLSKLREEALSRDE